MKLQMVQYLGNTISTDHASASILTELNRKYEIEPTVMMYAYGKPEKENYNYNAIKIMPTKQINGMRALRALCMEAKKPERGKLVVTANECGDVWK